MNIYSLI